MSEDVDESLRELRERLDRDGTGIHDPDRTRCGREDKVLQNPCPKGVEEHGCVHGHCGIPAPGSSGGGSSGAGTVTRFPNTSVREPWHESPPRVRPNETAMPAFEPEPPRHAAVPADQSRGEEDKGTHEVEFARHGDTSWTVTLPDGLHVRRAAEIMLPSFEGHDQEFIVWEWLPDPDEEPLNLIEERGRFATVDLRASGLRLSDTPAVVDGAGITVTHPADAHAEVEMPLDLAANDPARTPAPGAEPFDPGSVGAPGPHGARGVPATGGPSIFDPWADPWAPSHRLCLPGLEMDPWALGPGAAPFDGFAGPLSPGGAMP